MNDEHKKRGRPPRVNYGGTGSGETSSVVIENTNEDSVVDEAVVENPTQRLPEESSIGEDVDAPIVGLSVSYESPIEEKIHELVEHAANPVIGWENNMRIAPTDGRRIMVSQTGVGQGSLVYWRISKVVDKKNLRYIPKGRWTDFLSKKDIEFTPSYWKAYNPEEYWPLTV